MTPWLITSCVFVAAALLVAGGSSLIFDTFFRYRYLLSTRLEEESPSGGGSPNEPSLFKDVGTLRFDLKDARLGALDHVRKWLTASATRLDLGHLLAACVMLASVMGLVGLVLKLPGWGVLLTMAVGGGLPVIYIETARRRRVNRLREQLPEAFDVISRAVRAGRTLPATIQVVGEEMAPPLAEEFSHCFDQQQMGLSLVESLRQLAARTGVAEMKIFAVGLTVQAQSGGNVVELLDNLSAAVRKRQQQRTKMKAITAESRMQALVLGTLPLAAFVGLFVFAPDYVAYLLDQPKLLAGTICGQAAGALWIRSIVSVRA